MNKLHDQATPEEISTHLNDFMKDVGTDKSLSSDQEDVLSHTIGLPNFSKEHYDKVLNAYVSPNSVSNEDAAKALIDSKHFSPQDASRMLSSEVNGGNANSALINRLAAIEGVDKTPLEQHALNFINDHTKDVSDVASCEHSNLRPQFFQELLASRPEYVDGDELTPEQEAQNKRAHKIDSIALRSLMSTEGHTPESLEHAVGLTLDDKIKNHTTSYYNRPGADDDVQKDLIKELVSNQKGLSQDHLNKLYEKVKSMPEDKHSWRGDDTAESILSHPNVDPTLLSKIARKEKASYHDDELHAALSNPNLPHESINAIINDEDELAAKHRGLFRNPSLTKDQLTGLYNKGYKTEVLNHDNADADFHRQYWNESDKSTDAGRTLLDAGNTPADVLKELVGHKNQDVAIKALNHDNADASVVEAGLQRKAKNVQDAARRHPLVAEQEMKRGFAEGKISLQEALSDSHTKQYFQKLTPEEKGAAYEKMAEPYKGSDAEAIAEKQKIGGTSVWNQKYHLATSPEVPTHVREQNVKDIVDGFSKNTANNTSDFTYNRDNVKQHNYAAFNKLITGQDKHAQEAALSKPGYIQHFSDHFDKEDMDKMNPDFLNSVYDRLNNSVGEQVVARDGGVKRLTDQDMLVEKKNLLKSPKTSEDKVDHYLSTVKNDHLDPLLVHHNSLADGTILDKRYEKLPEDEKRAKFQKHLDMGRSLAVAASEEAPQDMRDAAFRSLSPEQQNDLVVDYDNNLHGFGDEILHDALHGKLNHPDPMTLGNQKENRDGLSAMEFHALNRLDSSNPNHQNMLDQYLTQASQDNGLPAWQQAGDTGISSALHRSWMVNHPAIFKKHSNAFPGMYFSALKQSMIDKMDNGSLSEKDANDAVEVLKQEAADYASQGQTPEGQQERAAEFWNRVVEGYKEKNDFFKEPIAKIVGHRQKSQESNGKLDFLVDIAKNDPTLKSQLLSKRLLSGPAAEDLSNSFKNYGEYLQSLPEEKRKDIIRGKIADLIEGKTDPSQLSYILNKMDGQALRGALGSSTKLSFDKEDFPVIENNMKKIYDAVSAYGHEKDFVSSLFTNGGLTKKDEESLQKSLLQHIIDTSPQEHLSKNVADFYDAVSTHPKLSGGSVTPSILSKIADVAASNNDTKTLVDIVQNNGDLPRNILSKVNAMARDSETLSAEQIMELGKLSSSNDFSASSIKALDRNFENSLNASLLNGSLSPAQVSSIRNQHVENLADVNENSSQEKAEAVTSILQKYRTFPDVQQQASKALQKYVASDKLNSEQRKNIYISLPERILGSSHDYTSLSRDLVNDPEIIADSTKGWKLASLVESVDEMNGDSISLLANRALAPESAAELDHHAKNKSWSDWQTGKSYVLSQIAAAPAARDQDVIKLIRSLSDVEMMEYVGQVTKEANLAETKNHLLINHVADKLSEMIKSPEKFNMEMHQSEHVKGLNQQIEFARRLVSKYDFDSEVTDFQEKKDACSKAVQSITEAHNGMMDAYESRFDKSVEQKDVYNNAGLSMDWVRGANIPWNGTDLVNIFGTLNRLEKGHMQYPEAEYLRPSKVLLSYKKAFGNAENVKSDTWQHLAATNPVYPFLLKEGNVISKDQIDHLDYKDLLNKNQETMNEEFSGWFKKMDRDALESHGVKILKSISSHLKENENASSSDYWDSIQAGLTFGDRFMDYNQLKDVLSGFSKTVQKQADSVCVRSGVGGSQFAEEAMTRNLGEDGKMSAGSTFVSSLLASPAISEKIADAAMKSFPVKDDYFTYAAKVLAGNKNLPQKNMSKLVDILLKNHREGYRKFSKEESSEIGVKAMKNPQISWDDLKTLFDETQEDKNITFSNNTQFHPAFINPQHGSKLLRSLPASVPPSLQAMGLSATKMQRDVLVGGKTRTKLTEAMQSIPPEGMAWAEFKRKFPKMENVQEIKDIFMRKNNKPVVAEDFVHAMKAADEKDKFNSFHVTYGTWSGAQRHNMKSGDNLVVQLNSSQKADMEIAQDPKAWALYQHILKSTNGISDSGSVGAHPTTPHLVSWSRVDVSNKGAWVIEEFQSDAAQKFRANIKSMLRNSPGGLKLEGQEISPDEIKGYLGKIDKAFENWQKASMDAVIENAKAHGIKRVYMHGVGIRSEMSGGVVQNGKYMEYSKDFINPRIKEIYDGNAQKFGFQKCSYTDYPNYDADTLSKATSKGLPTHCWYLDIP